MTANKINKKLLKIRVLDQDCINLNKVFLNLEEQNFKTIASKLNDLINELVLQKYYSKHLKKINLGQIKMKQYPKIDIHLLNRSTKKYSYYTTTTQSKTCKEAKEKFLKQNNYLSKDQVKCAFKKG